HGTSVLVDAIPQVKSTPAGRAETVRRSKEGDQGYAELSAPKATTIAGHAGVEWSYRVGDAKFVDYFVNLDCGDGYAVLGQAPSTCHQAVTAALVGGIDPTAVAVLGDNQYETGYLPYYEQVFDASWGQFRSKTFPVPGNHEYYRVGADGYYAYFGAAAGDPAR